MTATHTILVIAGPSGSGESTITNRLIALYPRIFARLVTATTRPPRGQERHAEHYYFFSKEEFERNVAAGDIVEVTHVAGRDAWYGSYKPDLEGKLSAGLVVIVNPDIVGARYYKTHYGATTIFVRPGSIEELIPRLRKRNPEITEAELAKRRAEAEREVTEEAGFYDYQIVNADGALDAAVEQVIDILKKEGYKLG